MESLDSEVIVVSCIENASQLLRGVVVLCLPVALKVKDVHLRMTGKLVIGYVLSSEIGGHMAEH